MNFTFKTTKPTGRYKSFYQSYHEIKYNKKMCGTIKGRPPHGVGFMVIKKDIMEDKNPNCEWKWCFLKTPEFQNVKEAKKWVKENTGRILDFFKKEGTPLRLSDKKEA